MCHCNKTNRRKAKLRTLPELQEAAVRVFGSELGYPDTVHFISGIHPGEGDYTRERDQLLAKFTLDGILAASLRCSPQPKKRNRRSA